MRPIAAFIAVCFVGIAGFVYFEGVSIFVAAFWLLDPTSIELHGVSDGVRAFALVVFAGIFLSALWIGETVVGAAFGGQIQEELRRVQTERRIDDLSDHVVICGYGIFGRTIANTLASADQDVIVVERDEHRFENIDDDDILTLQGDARMEGTLEDAGIYDADAVVAAIDDSNANIEIAILAKQLAPDPRVIVRVGNDRYSMLARRAGADEVIIPEITSGQHVSQSISGVE
jgi:voltage-gated potassium channel